MSQDPNYSLALSHIVLAGTGLYCLLVLESDCQCPYFIYLSRCAFATITVNASIGVWRHGNPSYGEDVDKVFKITTTLQDLLVLPCIVSSQMAAYGYSDELTFGNVFVPLVPLVSSIADNSEISEEIQNAIALTNSGTMSYLSYQHENYWGMAAITAYLFAQFGIQQLDDANIKISPQELENYSLCFFAIFSMKTLME